MARGFDTCVRSRPRQTSAALWRHIAVVCITEADEIVPELRIGRRFGVERDSQSNPVR
jgi:hypothetical protein